MLFAFVYYVIGVVAYIAMIPVLLLLSLKEKYRYSIPARFFLFNNPPFTKDTIWFHACSFGEVKALQPLIAELKQDVNISVITNTGYEASKIKNVKRRFLPFEIFLPFWINRQKALVVLEAELWFMLFWVAKSKGMKTYLLNARISDRSYSRYLRFRWFYKRIFQNIDMIFAQSQKDKSRLEMLGAKNVFVSGNIKAYQKITISHEFKKPSVEMITLASTHDGEEEIILDALDLSKVRCIVVVPRHPERFDKVDLLCQKVAKDNGLSYHRFSQRVDFESDIVLVDSMGVLVDIYAISDVVLLGGSFVNGVGGHNPLEPAYFHVKIVSGKYIFNQEALFPLVDHVRFCDVREIEKNIQIAKPTQINTKVDMMPIIEEFCSVV